MADMQQQTSSDAPLPTRPERIDFLRQMVAFTEGNIRSYDTKAQISVAAFVLTYTSYWMVATAGCARLAQQPLAPVSLLIYFLTILLFFYVLWPVKPKPGAPTAAPGVFFIRDTAEQEFGYYVVRLIARRLSADIQRAHARNQSPSPGLPR